MCCIRIKISIITLILIFIQVDSVVSERVYQFLASVLGNMRRMIQFLKASANHTTLTPPPTPSASCGVLDLNSSLPVEIRKIQPLPATVENSTATFNGRKLNYLSFQNPHGHDIIHTPAPFPLWGFILTYGDCYILSGRV